MNKKSFLTALLLMIVGLQTVLPQEIKTLMTIYKSNGTVTTVDVDDVDSISFVQIHQDNNKVKLQLQPFVKDFQGKQSMQTSSRRIGIPSGYTAYNPLEAPEIGFFITEDSIIEEGNFIKSYDEWSTHVNIRNDRNYQIYGFMPQEGTIGATITPNLNYTNGCIMTLSGLRTITSTDVCIATGVKQACGSFSTMENLQQGAFGFTGNDVEEGNYIYMLFDHLYTSIDLQICMDEEYDALRTIKLNRVSLKSKQYSTCKATVTMTANDNGSDPVSSIEWNYNDGNCEETVFDCNIIDHDTPFILSTSLQSIGKSFVLPEAARNSNGLILRTVFDVYDKAGNLIRTNCASENVFSISGLITKVLQDHNYNIKLKVFPTYLYGLSDPDLDIPTITIFDIN